MRGTRGPQKDGGRAPCARVQQFPGASGDSLPERKHTRPRAHGLTCPLSCRELTIPLYRDGPPFTTLRDLVLGPYVTAHKTKDIQASSPGLGMGLTDGAWFM